MNKSDLLFKKLYSSYRSKNLDFYLSLIRRGLVRGVICGPSCDTWSVDRFRQIHDLLGRILRGPRPVRSIDSPFGIARLTCQEYEQLEVGNGLLFAALEVFLATHLSGGCGLIEHPAPGNIDKPSIFRTESIIRLLNFKSVRKTTFLQGILGRCTPKPTSVLTSRLPAFGRFVNNFITEQRSRSRAQIYDDGTFGTAEAKTY